MLGMSAKSMIGRPIYLLLIIIISLLFVIQASIVIAWVNHGYISGSSESVQKTAKNLSVTALVPAVIVFAWTLFKFLCLYTPLKATPVCAPVVMSEALSGVVGKAKSMAQGAMSRVQGMKMPKGMPQGMKSGMKALMSRK